MSKAEVIAQDYFENKGFEVINLETRKNTWQNLTPSQKSIIKSNLSDKSILQEKGLFDLCLISEKGKVVFVEVKSLTDSMSVSQIDWPKKTNCETYVAIVNKEECFVKDVNRFKTETKSLQINKKEFSDSNCYDFSPLHKELTEEEKKVKKHARKACNDPENLRKHLKNLLQAEVEKQGGNIA